jgi:intermediate peptidase
MFFVENVRAFLDSLLEFSKPRALKALQDVQVLKQKRERLDYAPQIQAWDRDAYFPSISTPSPVKLPRISPGSSIFAFSRLLKSIYGISLQPSDVINGETWHKDVRKLDVVDETEGVVGWIYLDLFYRPGKAGGSTHYTLQCSRRVDDDDADADYLINHREDSPPDQTSIDKELERDWILATEKHTNSSREGAYQRPIAVISCDLDPARERNMDWQGVVTLWHELGHAMHCEYCSFFLLPLRLSETLPTFDCSSSHSLTLRLC